MLQSLVHATYLLAIGFLKRSITLVVESVS